MKTPILSVLALPLSLAACGGGGSPTVAINVPVVASGTVLAVELGATQTAQTTAGVTRYTTTPTEAQTSGRTTTAGVGITVSADADPAGTIDRPDRKTATADTLTDVAFNGALDRGATFNDVTNVSGTTYFYNGAFGNSSARTDAMTQIEGVSVFRQDEPREVILRDVAIVRVESFDSNTNEGVFGVGFIGNPTPVGDVPGAAAGSVSYTAALEYGQAIYNSNGTIKTMFIEGVGSNLIPEFDIVANFTLGTVTAEIDNIELLGFDPSNNGNTIVLNSAVNGFVMGGNITGNTISGTNIAFVDANGTLVGTLINQQVAGGFYGADAAEVALAGILEGAMSINDGTGPAIRDYVFSATAGGAQ